MSLKYTHHQQPSKTREYEDRWPRIANNIIVLLLEVYKYSEKYRVSDKTIWRLSVRV